MVSDFEYKEAELKALELLLALIGPSYSGKTYSALEIATGIQTVVGGDIALIDTENKRAAHYVGTFKFKHIPFGPPFAPDRYLKALQLCVDKGAKIIIVDSGSHCWESEGGVLEMHERELDRMAGDDWKKRDRANFAAWIIPKQAYTRLIQTMLQLKVHMIWCFRAKEKMDFTKKDQGKPADLGFMSIAGKEMMYEFQLAALLHPSSGGVPTWKPEKPGEKQMVKLPRQFEHLFKEPQPLTRNIGEELAKWAQGDVKPAEKRKPKPAEKPADDPPPDTALPADEVSKVTKLIGKAGTKQAVHEIADTYRDDPWSNSQREEIKAAISDRIAVIEGGE